MEKSVKWLTCTPVRFPGDHTFFSRDSGLLCKGFQEIGVDCKAVMPGPPMDSDLSADLIRTDYRNLEDPAWWRAQGASGVVFYGWGDGRYVKIARAIKRAGLLLVSNLDNNGLFSIHNGFAEYAGFLWRVSLGEAAHPLSGCFRFLMRLAIASSIGILRNDRGRARHLNEADVIGAVTPIALERSRRVCCAYGGTSLMERVRLIPHPSPSYMKHDPAIRKERLIVAMGRWDDERIKGAELLMRTTRRCLEKDPDLQVEVYGSPNKAMSQWQRGLPQPLQRRLHLKGVVSNTEIAAALRRARVSLCTSLTESYHAASAQALCCGCSVVGPDTPDVPSMQWFATEPFGRTAKRDEASLAMAVALEMSSWDHGERDSTAISQHWGGLLHAPCIAKAILSMFKMDSNGLKATVT